MAKKSKKWWRQQVSGPIRGNYSSKIRRLKPKKVVFPALAAQGIKASVNLIYLVKGSVHGAKRQRPQVPEGYGGKSARKLGKGRTPWTCCFKVKALAAEVGGLDTRKTISRLFYGHRSGRKTLESRKDLDFTRAMTGVFPRNETRGLISSQLTAILPLPKSF